MAKTFKSIASEYVITGTYFNRDTFEVSDFKIKLDSKDKRVVNKAICNEFNCKSTDIKIANIAKSSIVTTYTVDADIASIVEACRKAGITVTESVDDSDGDTAEAEAENNESE